jgi:uncharacterized protein involved in exopolysaccharide biosynthesis/Mrp family chromosome partitioning ATPase
MAQYDVDLRDYWRILKKRKAIIVFMVLLVGACSYAFAKFKEPPPLFRAVSAIKIESTSDMASLLLGGAWFPTENMVTHAYIITSFPVLLQSARELEWIPADIPADEIRKDRRYVAQLERLKGMVTAEQESGTNIINIQAIAQDPKEASRVANTIAGVYRDYNILEKNRKTTETKKFIEDQLQTTSISLKQAEQELKHFQEGYALISIDEQTRNLLTRIFDIETEYERIRVQRREVGRQIVAIDKKDSDNVESVLEPLISVPSDSSIFTLKSNLSELLLKRQTLLIHLTEQHPQVAEIDDKINAVIGEIRQELLARFKALKGQERALLAKLRQLRQENQSLPEKALQLVRLQREVELQENLYSQLKAKYQETLIQESGKVEQVSIVRPAVTPSQPFNIPSSLMIVITGLVMGMIMGIVLAFGAEVFDTSMGTIEDVEESLQVPVLGVIPYLRPEERERLSENERARELIAHYDPKSLAAEAFRSLRTNLQFMSIEIKGKIYMITSSFVQEGKTLNVINLALSVAQAGEKVLLVEADLRKPLVYKNFGLPKDPGLTDYVLGNYDWNEIVNNISDVMLGDFEIEDILRTPGLDNLNIVTAGTRPPNPTEIVSSARFKDFLKLARETYDYVFIDAPPILPVADATEIAPHVDGVVLVYTVGRISRGVLKRAKSTLDNVDARVLGVILNNVKP